MDTGLFMFSPLPFVYNTYPPSSPQSARNQLHANLVLPLTLLLFSLTLLVAYPRRSRILGEDRAGTQPATQTTTSISPTLNHSQIRIQRRNTKLTSSVRTLQLALRQNAFAAFRDRLLLHNRIWAQEKQILLLRSSTPTSVLTSTHAPAATATDPQTPSPSAMEHIRILEAKIAALEQARRDETAARDALDERRELLIAEIIQEIADDLEESQRQVERLRMKLYGSSGKESPVEAVEEIPGVSEKECLGERIAETPDLENAEQDLDQTLTNELRTTKEPQMHDEAIHIPAIPEPDEITMDDLFSDPGSPTPTIGGDDEHDIYDDESTDYASDAVPDSPFAFKIRALESPSPRTRSPSPPLSPSPPPSGSRRPFPRMRANTMKSLGVHPQSPGALALGSDDEKYTTSTRLLARFARTRSAIVSGRRALRFPMWSQKATVLGPVQEAGESTVSVNIFPGRSTKRARVDSVSSG